MRLACPQERLDCLPIPEVKLNLECRDEIIPILRALQHLYGEISLRQEMVRLVGNDINKSSSPKCGRRGLSYWEIIVLAAVRLGCNLDYDKLQDLAENHRNLQRIMGIGDWQTEEVDFDWRRLEDNITKLRPTTLEKINDLVVKAGHRLDPKAIRVVRGDTFVVETNIHYPTESSLIGDGLRKIVNLAAELAADHGQPGWRQHEHLLGNVKRLVREIGRSSRKKADGTEQVEGGYRELLKRAEDLMERARTLFRAVAMPVEPRLLANLAWGREQALMHYVELTEKVCDTARRRVLLGETVPNSEKIFSIFEPHTELIKRGKKPNPVQFGHKVLVLEDAAGFIVDYHVVANGVQDEDILVPVMKDLQKQYEGKIKSASFDRGFHTPENQQALAEIVKTPCIAAKGKHQGRRQHQEGTVAFRKARQNHPGVESAIGALQAGNGQKRCRDRGKGGYDRYVGLGILGRNLQTLGKLLLAKDQEDCQAAQSKRKREAS
jgi:hypothetical protein